MRVILPFAFLLSGCPSQDTPPVCKTTVEKTIPEDGATAVYYRDPIQFYLSDPDPAATVQAPFSGATTVSSDGMLLTYTPDKPLEPNTAYTVTLRDCKGARDLSFTTSAFGEALADPGALAGGAYALDLTSALITKPVGVGSIISSFISADLLFGVETVDAARLQAVVALSNSYATDQNLCRETPDTPGSDFSEAPYVAVGPMELNLEMGGALVPLRNAWITGAFSVDGASLGGATVTGVMDFREADMAVPDLGDALVNSGLGRDDFCTLLPNFGGQCVVCDDGQEECFEFQAISMESSRLSPALVPVTANDVASNPDCP